VAREPGCDPTDHRSGRVTAHAPCPFRLDHRTATFPQRASGA